MAGAKSHPKQVQAIDVTSKARFGIVILPLVVRLTRKQQVIVDG